MPATTKDPVGYGQSKEMRDHRKGLLTKATEVYQKAIKEGRAMNDSERTEFDNLTKSVEDHDKRIGDLEGLSKRDEDEDEGKDRDEDEDDEDDDEKGDRSRIVFHDERGKKDEEEYQKRHGKQKKGEGRGRNSDSRNNPSRRTVLNAAMRVSQLPFESRKHFIARQRRATAEYGAAAYDFMRYGIAGVLSGKHSRALQADIDILGGYLVLPEVMSQKLIKAVDNILWIQKKATVITIEGAQSMGFPTLDGNPDDGDWTTEVMPINPDQGMKFGKRSLTPTPIRKRLLVSERLLRMAFAATYQSADDANGSGGAVDKIVIERMAYKIAATKEKFFFLGNGVSQPLGLFTASSRGISTNRDVVTGSTTGVTYQGLLNAKFSLKVQYMSRAEWMISRAFMNATMGLVDTAGRPLLNFATLPNMPTTLLECGVNMSEYVPNTFTTGLYVGMLGDPTFYNICNSQDVTIKQAHELYAETGQIGFFITAESDGMPTLEEAWARLKTS